MCRYTTDTKRLMRLEARATGLMDDKNKNAMAFAKAPKQMSKGKAARGSHDAADAPVPAINLTPEVGGCTR